MSWEKAATIERLERGPVVFKRGARQLALFRVEGESFAIDNRCPHEGYPLAQGSLDADCVLTCNWHNWKFRLTDGRCVLGGDDVRTYPTREAEGAVWVDVSDPTPEEVRETAMRGLERAFEERDYGRICRELSRLHFAGLDPLDAVARAVAWSAERFEYGTGHAFAASADWLALAERFAGDWEKQLVCFAESIDHMAFDALRQPRFEFAEPAGAWDASTFLEAIEAERADEAVALARRAALDELGWDALEPSFARAALAHYNDFGHSLIYVEKTRELLARSGGRIAPFLLPALARHLAYTTREDKLPEFVHYAEALAEVVESRSGAPKGSRPAVPFPAGLREARAWLASALREHPVEAVYDALLEALARNLLHFDATYGSTFDRPVQESVGWLDFTHGLTFADAAHELCGRHPELWPAALVQMAFFLGRNRAFLDLEQDVAAWRVADPRAFLAEAREGLLDHGLRDPIFSAHLVKTTCAVERELEHASPTCREALTAALHRFLRAPLKQKHARRLARQAIELVSRDFG